jgi:protein-S-isoprenylcysteine O-methyltransferase Ste14
MVTLGRFLFHYRNALFPLVLAAGLLLAEPRYPLGSERLDLALDVVGFALMLAGQVLRVLTIGYRYIRRGGRNRQVHADRLVTGGVFAHSRNPLYLGNLLLILGGALVVNAPALYAVAIPFFGIAYAAIIRAEEDYLLGKFGAEYADYQRRVNRLWPDWTGFSRSVEGMTFDWRQVIRKEYSTTLLWLLVAPALYFWSEYRVLGESSLPQTWATAVWLTALAVAYVIVWALKKAGRLRSRLPRPPAL